MGLFGSDATIDLAVDREMVVPGDEIRVSASVGGERDDKVRGGRIELICRNEYKIETRDSDGDRRISRRADDIVVVDHSFGPDEISQSVTLQVPEGSSPSATDIVEWKVRALLDRRRAVDVDAERAITVLAPRAAGEWRAAQAPQVDQGCHMELQVPTRSVAPGDTISGTLVVSPGLETKAKEIRVAVAFRRVDSPGPNAVRDSGVAAAVQVSPGVVLAPNVAVSYPFALQIPPGIAPSLQARHNELRWFLEGIVSRSMKSDHNVLLELNVHNAP